MLRGESRPRPIRALPEITLFLLQQPICATLGPEPVPARGSIPAREESLCPAVTAGVVVPRIIVVAHT